MQRSVTFVLLIAFSSIATAQHVSAQTNDDVGLWFAALGNGKLPNAQEDSLFRWWLDAHYRLREDTDGFNQSIIRPGLGFDVAEDQTLWAGYGWIRTSPIESADFDEHRFWQQWTAAPSRGDWKFLHRSRFEQRWVETGDDVGLRWRQLVRGQKILSTCPQWSAVLWDELFFNLNDTDWGASTGFNQNRAFIGLGFRRCAHAKVRTEIGYLNQFENRQGGLDGMNHILSVNFFY